MPSSDMKAFQDLISNSKNIIAVAGAGLSAASGIPTFRGAGGMWRKYDAKSLATPEAFRNDPARVWQFYHYRREKALSASPNAAHYALAMLSFSTYRQKISPNSNFNLITQNVDGLSKRALETVQTRAQEDGVSLSQPEPMLEMHGRLFDVRCTLRNCGYTEWDDSSPICEALAGTELPFDEGSVEPDISTHELPRCKKCGGLARPGVVWFGEYPLHLNTIDRLVTKADLCLVIGTSSTVYPAALYADKVRERGGKVAVFNIERSNGDQDADFLFLGPCEETLTECLGLRLESRTSVNEQK